VLRAAVTQGRGGTWPRTAAELSEQFRATFERPEARWVAEPEAELMRVVLARLPEAGPAGPPIAAPAWGPPGWAEVLDRFRLVHWMAPARDRLDPGPGAVAQALDEGARAVLLTPIAGDLRGLPEAARLCRQRGALLMVDGRASAGSRALDGGPELYGDLVLLPPDGEPARGPYPGAMLCGAGNEPGEGSRAGGSGLRWAAAALRSSVRDEPRLNRFLGRPRDVARPVVAKTWPPPPWVVAACAARLSQFGGRSAQRARHARALRVNLGNLPAVQLIEDAAGYQSAGAAFAMLSQGRDGVAEQLQRAGIPTLGALAGWLAPASSRSDLAQQVADRMMLLPLHPFYRPDDLKAVAEQLRRATLLVNGTGMADPTEGSVTPEPILE